MKSRKNLLIFRKLKEYFKEYIQREHDMKFLILTTHGQIQVEAEDFDDAVSQAYDDHTGYDNVMAIVKVDDN